MFDVLLELQKLDLKIEACRAREADIPKQKGKFDVYRERLKAELDEGRAALRALEVKQRELYTDVEQNQAQIGKYETQLNSIKKNEEYQALVHEIDGLKKKNAQIEEQIIGVMVEIDEAKARLREDEQRIDAELKRIDQQCAEIDAELAEAVVDRKALEAKRAPIVDEVDGSLLSKYTRIRKSKGSGPAAVPLNGQYCTGCNMAVTPQMENEVLAGDKVVTCPHCGRILYHADNVARGRISA